MTESKKAKLVSAATATAVVVTVFLIAILTFQIVSFCVKKRRIKDYERELAILTENIEESEKDVDRKLQKWYIEQRARELGYVYADNGND